MQGSSDSSILPHFPADRDPCLCRSCGATSPCCWHPSVRLAFAVICHTCSLIDTLVSFVSHFSHMNAEFKSSHTVIRLDYRCIINMIPPCHASCKKHAWSHESSEWLHSQLHFFDCWASSLSLGSNELRNGWRNGLRNVSYTHSTGLAVCRFVTIPLVFDAQQNEWKDIKRIEKY